MPVAKTKAEEIKAEILAVEKARRAQGIWRLQTAENKLSECWKKGTIPRHEYIDCLSMISKLKADKDTLVSLTDELTQYYGDSGIWDQFFHYAHLGLVHQAYLLVKDINPIGLSLNYSAWLSIFHALNFENEKLTELANATSKAYPTVTPDQESTKAMVFDGLIIARLLEEPQSEDFLSITRAIEYALAESIPTEQLTIHGIEYNGGQMPTDFGDQYVLDINYIAPELSVEEICDIDKKFERALMQQLPLSIQSKCCITLVEKAAFYD